MEAVKESIVSRLKRKILKTILLHLASEDIPNSVLKETNIKQLFGILYWAHWVFKQKETKVWFDTLEWGDPEVVKQFTNNVWNRYSKDSQRWIESIDVGSQFNYMER